MALGLYDAVVPNFVQVVQSVQGILDKAQAWAEQEGMAQEDLLAVRLAPDMLPLAYQFKSCWTHSAHAIAQCGEGRFSPHVDPAPTTFDGVRELLDKTLSALEAVEPQTLDAMADRTVVFSIGEKYRLDFTVQNFLLSFSTPNVFFHAATAYDILRMQGVALQKRDFLGRMRSEPR